MDTPANRRALQAALRTAGVAEGHYRIEGVHEPAPTPPDFLFLRQAPDGAWETGVYERGVHHVITRHRSEEAACEHLLRMLT
ncbi:hypothetical protein CP973_18430 [Streptomyces albofaciens JCM 4342]|uniref:hypothetical protein n=1 Tax=Streptomyces albofaciens TaxID=66866 RepID=UPI00123A93BC|nr:hypothetical protein [Streptomyces albofaciens]KAA6223632.1 hypothetical protein CP973_18430 [Streptomyces albofaciens JCM 4342]